MSEILTLHGAVPGVDRERIRYQNQSDREVLREFLAAAPRFVPLEEALAGRGDALTIDDATRAGVDAALLAREHGHAVTLFVNPEQVESGEPYWFSLLHELLDRLDRPSYEYDGVAFPVRTRKDRRALRDPIKTRCRLLRDEPARLQLVRDLWTRWLGGRIDLPPFLETVGVRELLALRDAGVDFQNHGWSHIDHAILSIDESRKEIDDGREWLRRELAVDAPHFAVPFGDIMPKADPRAFCRSWLTLYWEWPIGELRPGVVNRTERDFSRAAAPAPPRPASPLARLWRRVLGR